MKVPAEMPRLKGYRFAREVVACAVWVYHRFALGTADVKDLLAERGVIVSQETVRRLREPVWVGLRKLRAARAARSPRQIASRRSRDPDQWAKVLASDGCLCRRRRP